MLDKMLVYLPPSPRTVPAVLISAVPHPLRRCVVHVCCALLLCLTFSAQAALNCTYSRTDVDMFAGNYGGFFGFADDFDKIGISHRVGPMREVNLVFSCTITRTTSAFGVGRKAVPGIQYDVDTDTYTTAQLRANGLGYRIWWHQMGNNNNLWYPEDNNPDLTQDATPYQWVQSSQYRTTGTFELLVPVRVIFFKINDNFRNTGGNYETSAISAGLFRFYVADRASASAATVAGTAYTYTLSIGRFASSKRVCTPFVDRTIRFPALMLDDLPPSGVVAASTREFSLTFDCPYMAWYTVGFSLRDVYGVVDVDNGVFGIKQGAGYAQGIGIQIEAEHVASGWTGNMNSSAPWQVLKPATDYFIPWLEYAVVSRDQNPATASRTRIVNFRASYYRLPGALAAGKVESAVLIHFVYK